MVRKRVRTCPSNKPAKGKDTASSSNSSEEESSDTEPDGEIEHAAAHLKGWYDYDSVLLKDDDGISTSEGSKKDMVDAEEAGS